LPQKKDPDWNSQLNMLVSLDSGTYGEADGGRSSPASLSCLMIGPRTKALFLSHFPSLKIPACIPLTAVVSDLVPRSLMSPKAWSTRAPVPAAEAQRELRRIEHISRLGSVGWKCSTLTIRMCFVTSARQGMRQAERESMASWFLLLCDGGRGGLNVSDSVPVSSRAWI